MNEADEYLPGAHRRAFLQWNIRSLMAEQGMFKTVDLAKPLKDRGINLSRSMIYNIVSGTPKRINTDLLAALCDILKCSPNDLLELKYEQPRAPTRQTGSAEIGSLRPVRATVRRPEGM